MENLNSPAYPLINQEGSSLEDRTVFTGLNKMELASLMIAQGLMTPDDWNMEAREKRIEISASIAKTSVLIAKAVLEEATK